MQKQVTKRKPDSTGTIGKKLPYFFFITLLFAPQVFALLPPFYQSIKEITAILNNSDVIKKLNTPYPISNITKTENGYQITVQECTLNVIVEYIPPKAGWVGPAEFKIQPGELVCKQKAKES